MDLKQILRSVMLFSKLSDDDLEKVSALCKIRKLARGEILAKQGTPGTEFYIVTHGFVEVSVDSDSGGESSVLVNLGRGQIIGEMALVDEGPRSATVRAINDQTEVQVIRIDDFNQLCEQNSHIGFIVMKDIAADLSFKLRHRNLTIG